MKKYYILFLLLMYFTSCKDIEELLQPPVATEATNVKDDSFTANWKEHYGCETFLLYVSEDPEFDTYLPGYEGKEVEGNAHTVVGLEYEQTYYYKVRAKVKDKLTDYSNVIEVVTSKFSLDAPVALECAYEDLSYEHFYARWEPVEGAEKYVLEVAYDKEFKHYVEKFERRVTQDVRKQVNCLRENTTYYYRVRAVKGKTWSRYSNVIECRTPARKLRFRGLNFFYRNQSYHSVNGIYDSDNRLVELRYRQLVKVNDNNEYEEVVNVSRYFKYDAMGRLKTLLLEDGSQEEYFYDEQDRVKSVKVKNSSGIMETTYVYTYTAEGFIEVVNYGEYHNYYTLDEYGNVMKYKRGDLNHTYIYTYDDNNIPNYINQFWSFFYDMSGQPVKDYALPKWKEQTFTMTSAKEESGLIDAIGYSFYYNSCLTPSRAWVGPSTYNSNFSLSFYYEGGNCSGSQPEENW
jgi:YD repeat-containing protein